MDLVDQDHVHKDLATFDLLNLGVMQVSPTFLNSLTKL
jgi:hypothetical protein